MKPKKEMNDQIPISFLNDFLFCPRSIYFHNLYSSNFANESYTDTPQKSGTLNHETIDTNKFSSKKSILQGLAVYCSEFNLFGKIDTLDQKTGELVERKSFVREIYEGYKMQLFGQYFCLREMGFDVKKLAIYSMRDNKKYEIALPTEKDEKDFGDLITKINNFSLRDDFEVNENKCEYCIYSELCDVYKK